MTRLLAALIAISALLIPSTVQARRTHSGRLFPVTITDDHGNKIHLVRAPKRIITLFPGQTEIIFALGLENRLVADGSQYVEGANGIVGPNGKPRLFKYPSEWPSRFGRNYPIRSKTLPHVEGGCCGTHFNLETVESVHPDLVIAPYTQTELPTYQKMRELGIKVMILDPANLRGVIHDIRLVGRATGAVAHARTLANSMNRQLRAIRKAAARYKKRPRVYYEIDATNPTEPYTAGHDTFIDDAIKLVQGSNVADAARTCSGTLCYPQLDLESLVRLNPQVIVLGDANYGTTPAQVKARPGWETMAAIRSGRIYRFNDDLISRAGPRIMIGVRDLARDVHPGIFRAR